MFRDRAADPRQHVLEVDLIDAAQVALNNEWATAGFEPFPLGIGISTGEVAAALLGSEERLEYTVVGDAVNLCQRLQQFAADGEIVVSDITWDHLSSKPDAEDLGSHLVKGRTNPVHPRKIGSLIQEAAS